MNEEGVPTEHKSVHEKPAAAVPAAGSLFSHRFGPCLKTQEFLNPIAIQMFRLEGLSERGQSHVANRNQESSDLSKTNVFN